MNDTKQCWTCIYGMNTAGVGITCMSKTVNRLAHKPDKYNCEFYEAVSENYESDIEKVMDDWDVDG